MRGNLGWAEFDMNDTVKYAQPNSKLAGKQYQNCAGRKLKNCIENTLF